MTTWREVTKGDAVMLGGKRFVVTKFKLDGKAVRVTVVGGGGKFTSTVKAKATVERAVADAAKPRERWATKSEAKAALKGVPKGDANVTTPPPVKMGDPWETPRDRVERKLDKILGAHLVGEALDEDAGYYVPPVDITTVAAHVALFHGVNTSQYGIDDLLELHRDEHEGAERGTVVLTVNHWHTETRPAAQ